jgi:hypothetical protein
VKRLPNSVDSALQNGNYAAALKLFMACYKRVNAVFLLPFADQFLTIQLPLNHAQDRHGLCRADFIVQDQATQKVLHHGFFQFAEKNILAYRFEGDILSFALADGGQLRIIGLND